MSLTFLLHLFSTFFLTGLIWIVQLVHYPTFKYVDKVEFIPFENFHKNRISIIVIPLMFTELITGMLLYYASEFGIIYSVATLLLICTWLSTFFLSVPLHSKLSAGKNIESIRKLILTNWPRTIFWTLRSLMLSYITYNKLN